MDTRSEGGGERPRAPDRRRFVGAVAAGGAVAWVAPAIISVPAAAAATVAPGAHLVATGTAGSLAWTSADDGRRWHDASSPITGTGLALATDGAGRWVAVGGTSPRAWTSGDGTTWIADVPATSVDGVANGVATDGAGAWVAVGQSGSLAWTSTDDGATWTPAAVPVGDTAFAVATDAKGNWVAVGGSSSGGAWRSSDAGRHWTPATVPIDGVGFGVATDGAGLWVAVGASSTSPTASGAWTSTDDGATWQAAATPAGGFDAAAVATDGRGVWVAVGADGVFGAAWTANAGATIWDPAVLAITNPGRAIATDGAGSWVAVGTGSRAWTSVDDGETWAQAATPMDGAAAAVAYGRRLP